MQIRQAFDEYRFAIHHHSSKTQRWYVQLLEVFLRWCDTRHLDELAGVKPLDVRRFLGDLREGESAKTGKSLST